MRVINKNILVSLCLYCIFFVNNAISASFPDFTNIVEQNMPAVVIVNATRTASNSNGQNQFQTPPGMPDEFNDLFKKFLDETKGTLNEELQAQARVSYYQLTAIL